MSKKASVLDHDPESKQPAMVMMFHEDPHTNPDVFVLLTGLP